MLRSVFLVLVLALGSLSMASAAQDDKAVPKELQQYIQDAQKAGLTATQIRQNALKAGWPETQVEGAMAVAKTPAKAPESDAPKTVEAPAQPVTPPASDTAPAKTDAPAAAEGGNPKPDPSTKPVSVEGARGEDYLIGEGDVLQISVWGEPTASVPVATVRTDGKISMPLIKEVPVAGLTPSQVEKNIQAQLANIIRSPDVTVIVAQINSKKIYLTGAVKREGPLKFTYRMTVLQAISEAGGLTDYAKRKEIYVLHTEDGRQYKLPFNYTAVLRGEHMEQNIKLSPGDTIVVP
jgi:polysaccharide export outer membrane protein